MISQSLFSVVRKKLVLEVAGNCGHDLTLDTEMPAGDQVLHGQPYRGRTIELKATQIIFTEKLF